MKERQFCCFCGYKLENRFLEERDRLYCVNCQIINYENPIPAAAAVVFNRQKEILLVKRNVEPQKGKWCLPGGFIELSETPETACLRELKEETGLTGRIGQLIDVVLSPSPEYKSVHVMGYTINEYTGEPQAGDDAEEVAFFKLTELPEIAFKSHILLLNRALTGSKTISGTALTNPGSTPDKQGPFGAYVITSNEHVLLATGACAAGARILQYRDKTASKKTMLAIAKQLRQITKQAGTLLIINDYIDIALLAGADGVHLGQDDLPLYEARKLVPPGFLIGISTHSLEQARAAEAQGADYIGLGPVYATPTKASYPPIGLQVIRDVIRHIRLPVVAIGGINLNNFKELAEMGIKNIAMVREFQANTQQVIQQVNRILSA